MKKRTEPPTGKGAPRKPTVKVKPHSYQPTAAELDEDLSIDADPDDLARAVLHRVVVEETDDA